ncbi:SMP-30/gluconolactonase/LRE family protein [Streptomyces cellulosae]|uniref:SMP-30/gluconolactonase/LRE family protein n=1 Tax=Streptomyces cellulosae TaxID=1968 RepID=UPI0004C7646E|nr:SMP-30/gluconolactonase/LRE family protein [Streptomyces cellulosae]
MTEWHMVERKTHDVVGEGAIWSARDNAVYWTDIYGLALNRLRLEDDSVTRWETPEPMGWVIERERGGFIGGFRSGFAEVDVEPFGIRPIGDPEPNDRATRMNDAKADSYGNIWCGTCDVLDTGYHGSIYRLAPDLTWQSFGDGWGAPNGPAFSTDGAYMYMADSTARKIYRYEMDGADPGRREDFVTFAEEEGYPDGLTVDAEGGLWCAHFGAARVSRFTPEGDVDRVISFPASQTTTVTFAGQDLDRMFVTSASWGLKGPYDGGIFEVDPGVKGLPSALFAG